MGLLASCVTGADAHLVTSANIAKEPTPPNLLQPHYSLLCGRCCSYWWHRTISFPAETAPKPAFCLNTQSSLSAVCQGIKTTALTVVCSASRVSGSAGKGWASRSGVSNAAGSDLSSANGSPEEKG